MSRRTPLLVLLVALVTLTTPLAIDTVHLAPVTQAQPSSELDGFDAFVADVMRDWKVPGLAVGVIRDGTIVVAKGYGYRDVGKKLPVTSQTLMAIGSNSKSFTATLMGMLVDERKLELDKPVRTYLPDFALQDDVATRLMTPIDLVTHRSGLPRHDAMWGAGGFTRKELYERLRFLEPTATFRQRYQYNNLMFMTAGVLVEQVAGQPWEALIKDRIFTPLGMMRSNTSVRDMAYAPDFSLPYVERGGKVVVVPFRNIDAVGPAGAINSNIDEMLRYVQMHIDQGSVNGKPIVSRAFSARMQAVHSAPDFTFEADDPVYTEMGPGGYGLGVLVRSYRGHKHVSHTGGIDGFISAMTWLPNDRIGIVVLSNLSGTNPVSTLVTQHLCDRLLRLPPVDVVARVKAAQERSEKRGTEREQQREAERVTGTSPSHPLADYAGTYEHPAYGPLTIAENAGQLTMAYGFQRRGFEHFHYDVFRAVKTADTRDWDARGRLTFTSNGAGRIESVAVPLEPALPGGVIFKRKPASTGTSNAGPVSLLGARVPEPSIGAQTSPRAEATSLGGQPLVPPADIPNRARLETDLAQAEKDLSARPNDADAIIWVGRRQAYLWRFQDAIATFAKGIALHPAHPKLLRHRGHRYITVRQFERAIADLEKAAGLITGTADEVEPDGAPNASGKPRSTLHFNIWYHLGLAHYLTGNYTRALDAYTECMKVSTNDDAIVATSDWMWMTLMRLNRKADAAKLLERISSKMEILENGSYHRRLLMYKGIEKPEALLDPGNADDLTIATQGYGVGNYFDVSGDRNRARQIFAKVVSGRQWNAFGFIAAEADLQRMK